MYAFLSDLHRRPEPFSTYSTDILWTDAHLAQEMLAHHLSQDTPLASRTLNVIEMTVEWIEKTVGISGRRLCDLGCGPGLYATRFAERGAYVKGIDFSANSIAYAEAHAKLPQSSRGTVTYRVANYLTDPLPGEQDVVTLIYCDYCPLSPAQRALLLAKIRQMLAPAGRFVLDVVSDAGFANVKNNSRFGRRYMNGFWSAEDYFAFHHTFRYDADRLALDRFTIVEQDRTWEVFNWLQYFTPETLAAELRAAGFKVLETAPGFDKLQDTFVVVATPKEGERLQSC